MAYRNASKPLARVLVPVCGNSADAIALRLACDIARKSKAKIFAIFVIEVRRALPLDADLPPEVHRGEDVLLQAERLTKDMDYSVETELLQAREVGVAIVDEASQRGIDLIIMGLRYKRQFGEFTLGATVPYVLKNAPCEVWVCRESEGPGAD